jgi:hypothetical protein
MPGGLDKVIRHLQNMSLGCGSGGAKRHSTFMAGSKKFERGSYHGGKTIADQVLGFVFSAITDDLSRAGPG